MEEFNKKKLSKLSPKERIKKLKKLEEKSKKEVHEIESLIKKSINELKTEDVVSEVAPEPRDVDIGELFETKETKLEKTVIKEAPMDEEPLKYIGFKQAYEEYKQIQSLSYASIMGTMGEDQLEALDQIGERLDKAKYVSMSAEAANILVASKAVLHKIKKYAGLD